HEQGDGRNEVVADLAGLHEDEQGTDRGEHRQRIAATHGQWCGDGRAQQQLLPQRRGVTEREQPHAVDQQERELGSGEYRQRTPDVVTSLPGCGKRTSPLLPNRFAVHTRPGHADQRNKASTPFPRALRSRGPMPRKTRRRSRHSAPARRGPRRRRAARPPTTGRTARANRTVTVTSGSAPTDTARRPCW